MTNKDTNQNPAQTSLDKDTAPENVTRHADGSFTYTFIDPIELGDGVLKEHTFGKLVVGYMHAAPKDVQARILYFMQKSSGLVPSEFDKISMRDGNIIAEEIAHFL